MIIAFDLDWDWKCINDDLKEAEKADKSDEKLKIAFVKEGK